MTTVDDALTDLARNESGRIRSLLVGRFKDLDLADDAVQEALIEASQRWPDDGIPANPAGWLHQVARRKAIDLLRRDDSRRRRLEAAAPEIILDDSDEPTANPELINDDVGVEPGDEQLRLTLLCCHPALDLDTQVALTLRLVGGLTTDEIAAAFLVPTPTLAARVTRAKKKIRIANIPMGLPDNIDDRIGAVLAVLYLTFNEGYLSRSGAEAPMRVDLCDEALRLTAVLCGLVPEHAEAQGLYALMRLTHARRHARFNDGELVLLDDQDRTTWELSEIREGNAAMARAMELMQPGLFQMQALIASHHSNARTAADTDWPQIVGLYDQLMSMKPSPVVALNRAAAIAMADGPLSGLKAIESIEGLDDYHLYHATVGELHARAGNTADAVASLQRARDCTQNTAERRHLSERLTALI